MSETETNADALRVYCQKLAGRLRAVPRYVITSKAGATSVVAFSVEQVEDIAAKLEELAGDGPGLAVVECKSCGASIVWLKTAGNRNIPVNAETVRGRPREFDAKAGHVSHFATCPNADSFRRRRGKE